MTDFKNSKPTSSEGSLCEVTEELINALVELGQQAGELILEVYHRDAGFDVDIKSDRSPVTEADKMAHHCILDSLSTLTPDVPILSEESALPSFTQRRAWNTYWLIDPLDGTKEFIHRNHEFTVNIALIHNGVAILGMVYVPVTGVTYIGSQKFGAFKYLADGTQKEIAVRTIVSRIKDQKPIEIVASRRHGFENVEKMMNRLRSDYPDVITKNIGSSLKLCLIAEGEADLYPRFGPTSEWDTAAAQAVVEAAGGAVVDMSFSTLRYNEKDDLLNPSFIVIGDTSHDWRNVLSAELA
ncbi:MAG: 3'(2'),5'-bisphosphate nucleotidase CysQ [Cellvibrionaceae bacterium]